jgi:hypothetical protein
MCEQRQVQNTVEVLGGEEGGRGGRRGGKLSSRFVRLSLKITSSLMAARLVLATFLRDTFSVGEGKIRR